MLIAHALCSCYFALKLPIHQDVFSSSAELASLARLDTFLFGSSWINSQSLEEKYNLEKYSLKDTFLLGSSWKVTLLQYTFSFIKVKWWKWVETNCRPYLQSKERLILSDYTAQGWSWIMCLDWKIWQESLRRRPPSSEASLPRTMAILTAGTLVMMILLVYEGLFIIGWLVYDGCHGIPYLCQGRWAVCRPSCQLSCPHHKTQPQLAKVKAIANLMMI